MEIVEIQRLFHDVAGIFPLSDVVDFIIPSVGVGGGVEAKEYIDFIPLVKFTLVFLAGVGTIFGLGLAFAAKRFAVQVNPKVGEVMDVLAHAHCGACGYARPGDLAGRRAGRVDHHLVHRGDRLDLRPPSVLGHARLTGS